MLSKAPWHQGAVSRAICASVDEREDAKKRNHLEQVGSAKRHLGSGVCSGDPMSCAQLLPSPRISLEINEGIDGKKRTICQCVYYCVFFCLLSTEYSVL